MQTGQDSKWICALADMLTLKTIEVSWVDGNRVRHVSSMDSIYEVHGGLGRSGFAVVRRAMHRITGKVYAVKTIDLSKIREDQRLSLRQGVERMRTLDHPNLIKIRESFENENELNLVLELGDGGNVFDNKSCSIMLELFEYFLLNTSVLYPPPTSPSNIESADDLGV
jgi:serine/threonine protein kinase